MSVDAPADHGPGADEAGEVATGGVIGDGPGSSGEPADDVVALRPARPADADAVATLHADSWRRNYRGAYADSYLDGPVFEDRITVWRERLGRPGPHDLTIVAERGGTVVGFVHLILDRDRHLGGFVENLHVIHHDKGRGVGTTLLAAAAREVLRQTPTSGLYLRVLEQNTAAQGFYRSRGGTVVERTMAGPFAGGGTAPALVVAWPDPAVLVDPAP